MHSRLRDLDFQLNSVPTACHSLDYSCNPLLLCSKSQILLWSSTKFRIQILDCTHRKLCACSKYILHGGPWLSFARPRMQKTASPSTMWWCHLCLFCNMILVDPQSNWFTRQRDPSPLTCFLHLIVNVSFKLFSYKLFLINTNKY